MKPNKRAPLKPVHGHLVRYGRLPLSAMRIAAFACITFLFSVGCTRSVHEVASSSPRIVDGAPSAVYDRVLPLVRARINEGTSVVRVDENGAVLMRFSIAANDRSLRLIEVTLDAMEDGKTEVSVFSTKFSFLPGASRDEIDLETERHVLDLFAAEANQASEGNLQVQTWLAGL